MDKLKTILVPVDFSERSIAAAEHAAALAKKFDSNLIFANVIPRLAYDYAAFEGGAYVADLPTKEQLRDNADKRLDELIENASPDRPVAKLVMFGHAADEIVRQTEETEIDLIVIPTHGYGTFRRFVLGSVTTKVLHDVHCPVLTGAHVAEIPSVDHNPYRSVACAVDLTEHSDKVIRWARDFADAYGADLTLVHAVPELTTGTPYGEWFPQSTRDLLVSTGVEKADEALAKAGCRAKVHVASGPAPRVVREFCESSGTELLVVGRSSHEAKLGRLRTNAYAIIRESPCPVVSV